MKEFTRTMMDLCEFTFLDGPIVSYEPHSFDHLRKLGFYPPYKIWLRGGATYNMLLEDFVKIK